MECPFNIGSKVKLLDNFNEICSRCKKTSIGNLSEGDYKNIGYNTELTVVRITKHKEDLFQIAVSYRKDNLDEIDRGATLYYPIEIEPYNTMSVELI